MQSQASALLKPLPYRRVSPTPVAKSGVELVSLCAAREIMGRNYVPMFDKDTAASFSVNETFLRKIMTPQGRLISEQELIECRQTHVLILVPQGSIIQLRDEVRQHHVVPIFRDQSDENGKSWYDNEFFAREQGRPGWHLVRKNLLGVNIHPSWDVQRRLLSHDEATPTTRVMVYTLARFFLATGDRLAADAYARCSSFDGDGYRGKVGYFGREGFSIVQGSCSESPFASNKKRCNERPDSHRVCYGNIGLAAEKKQI